MITIMPHTLDSLHRATIANPEDRTIRLVYADALDEAGGNVNAARAEFIRAQVELENVSEGNPHHVALAHRRDTLFDKHWLTWWRPVCEAAGFPLPHIPGRWARLRVGGLGSVPRRQRRSKNWPYTHTTSDTTIHANDYSLAIRFAGGFPEEIRFSSLDSPQGGPELIHRWGNAMPLRRLTFSSNLSPDEWERVDGPHLSRLPELTFHRLSSEVAPTVTQSPNLAAITRLTVSPNDSGLEMIRSLVAAPTWSGLQTLHIDGRLYPDAVRALASSCTLEHLEELDLTLGFTGELGHQLGEILNDLVRLFRTSVSTAPPIASWSEFGPCLESLAAAPWVARLRRLTLKAAPKGLRAFFDELFERRSDREVDVVPDRSILALAESFNPDKLERLVLHEAIISPATRDKLTARLGDRVAFT
jgi:uncharacterized protein (TIGR02996 family)